MLMPSDRARRDVMLARKVLAGTSVEAGKFPPPSISNFTSVHPLSHLLLFYHRRPFGSGEGVLVKVYETLRDACQLD